MSDIDGDEHLGDRLRIEVWLVVLLHVVECHYYVQYLTYNTNGNPLRNMNEILRKNAGTNKASRITCSKTNSPKFSV